MQDLTSFFYARLDLFFLERVTIGIERTYCSTPAPITALVYAAQYPSTKST